MAKVKRNKNGQFAKSGKKVVKAQSSKKVASKKVAAKQVGIALSQPVSFKINGVEYASKLVKVKREVEQEVNVLSVPEPRVEDFKRLIVDSLGSGILI